MAASAARRGSTRRPASPAWSPCASARPPPSSAPAVAIRLWSEALHRGLAPQDRPAILEEELSGLALDLAAWGAEPGALAFLDPPPAGTLAAARALLRDLDALDAEGRVTAMGRRMARLGTHPRLARMLAAAET